MALCEPIKGVALQLRCVEVGDAQRIFDLRTDAELTRYLPPLQGVPSDQERWIEAQRGKPRDYYFAIEKMLKPATRVEGFVGLYGFSDDGLVAAEWGRWILARNSRAAVETAYLIYRFAFESLGLGKVVCYTILANKSVVSFHDRCGLKRVRILKGEFNIRDEAHDAVMHEMTASDWSFAKVNMLSWAERFAPLLSR